MNSFTLSDDTVFSVPCDGSGLDPASCHGLVLAALDVVVEDLENLGVSENVLGDLRGEALREAVLDIVDEAVDDVVCEDGNLACPRVLEDVGVGGQVEGNDIG